MVDTKTHTSVITVVSQCLWINSSVTSITHIHWCNILYNLANRSDTTYLTDSAISSYLFDIDYIDSIAITREELKAHYHLYECNDIMGIPALNYLKKRLQYKYEKFLYSESERLLYILNLTPSGNVIGYQTRPILNKIPGYVQKYKSYCITKIRGAMGLVFDDIDL